MCGITGVVELRPGAMNASEFDRFTDSLSHRGPDGRGVHLEKGLYLGHRRLKILDVSPAGAQPMSDLQKRYWITFNGEIYNFLELRAELGGSFRTDSDTEVILAAYDRWGPDCQLKFNGMWAFAIWDSWEKTLFLSRDRFGVKPLYMYQNEDLFAFASELKSFLFLSSFPLEFDVETIGFSLRNISLLEPTPHTLLKGGFKLQPGHCAVFKDKQLHVSRWWNTLDHVKLCPTTFEEQTEKLFELFQDACCLRLRSDVPLGCALSGGLDSSSVVSLIAKMGSESLGQERRSPDWQRVFTASYPGTSQDEKQYAERIVKSTGLKAHYLDIRPEDIPEAVEKCLYSTEDPFELPIGPWLLYRKFRQEGTVISVDGHGADELFGGYHHQVEAYLLQHGWSSEARNAYATLRALYPDNFPGKIRSFTEALAHGSLHYLQKYPRLHRTLLKSFRTLKGKKDPIQIPYATKYERASSCFQAPRQFSHFNQTLFEDFHRRTLPTILRNFDRCSMAHGIEVRAPFLDWRLVCYAFSLPDQAKMGHGLTKRIVREMMNGIVPDPIRLRTTKIGFANPLVEWLKTSLKEYVLDSASSASFLQSSLWDGRSLLREIEEGYSTQNISKVRGCWEILQMHQLMTLFQDKKNQQFTRVV